MNSSHASGSLNRLAASATLHCLTGCSIGEVLGLVIGSARGWGNAPTIALAVVLAFAFGYALTMLPLLRSKMPVRNALRLALLSDTASIALMELVDNVVMLAIPGAMEASLVSPLFWISMAAALGIAGLAAYPLNRWLIARGQGHAVVHGAHGHGGEKHGDQTHGGHGQAGYTHTHRARGAQASSREPR